MSKKGEAKKRKAERLRNKKLIERYPWLRPVGWHGERLNTYSFTMYDDVPSGWKRAFGKIMLEDYRDVLIRYNYLDKFQWVQVKEKFGTLRLYSNAAPQEVLELESKYDYISSYVCISCGRLNAPVLLQGWIEPLCENCYNKRIVLRRRWHEKNSIDSDFTYTPYGDIKKQTQEIELIATYKCFSKERGAYEKRRDYSDTINKIIKRQKRLFTLV
ncbi:MAG: hypothetical protein E7241_11245 [Lachnospiraceae bacterium]|nr:hypothetical protein [Lachnospiraceae bacterium]